MRWNKWESPLKAALGALALDRKWPTCAESFTALLSTTTLCDTNILGCLWENIIRIQDIHYSLFWSMPTQPHKQNISIARLSGKELRIVCLGDFCLSLWWQVTRQYFVDRHLWSLNCWSFVSHNCCHGINVKNAENNFGITSKFTDRPTGAPTLTASSRSLQKNNFS